MGRAVVIRAFRVASFWSSGVKSDIAPATIRKYFLSTVAEGRRFYTAAPVPKEKTKPRDTAPVEAAEDDSSDN
jgi:hypothetical protein